MAAIGSLNEKPLHAALKEWCRREGDLVEVEVDGFVADLMRDGLLIEIQTKNFASMKRKFDTLLDEHPIRLVHPIGAVKWIVKLDEDEVEATRRRSPKKGMAVDVCSELVSFPTLLSHPNFSLEVLLVEEEEVWRPHESKGWRRNGYVIEERRLVDVVDSIVLDSPRDLLGLVPSGLPDPFTTKHLADLLGRPRRLAQQLAYCLRESGVAEVVERDHRGYRYRVAQS